MRSWQRTIRVRLAVVFIAIIAVGNTLVSLGTILNVSRVLPQEVQVRVRMNLRAAEEVYRSELDTVAAFANGTALDRDWARGIEGGEPRLLVEHLQRVQREGGLDILCLLDARGRLLVRAGHPADSGDDMSGNPLVAEALRSRQASQGTVIVSHQILAREGRGLAERAFFEVRRTPGAGPGAGRPQRDGMVIGAVTPIRSPDGRVVGLLWGANLLNRRFELVDRIKREVLQRQGQEGTEVATATIFQGDLRISTNVPTRAGRRAVGTHLSKAVREKVLGRGQIWADRAFVVNDWYITAYSPIRDPEGRVIGALYVGFLEAPLVRPQRAIVTVFLAIMGLSTVVTLVALFFITRHILSPIGSIIGMAKKVTEGDLAARVEIRPPGEMGVLCIAINQMADAVAQREAQVQLATRQQIGQSEKLASIGRLAAGIAHEINNPLTGVLTFTALLRKRPNLEDQDRADLDTVLHETTRVREIVRGLLEFARESPLHRQALDPKEVIRQTMTLVRSQKEFRKVSIVENLADTPPIVADKNQLQQVLLNLALNACEAMPDGGTLTVGCAARGERLIVTVADTGLGIKPGDLSRIFDPFFTTKPVGKGTGLGLSVSYGIIQKHDGTIEVESAEGKGTTFTIILPLDAAPRAEAGR